ncbi:MAG: hypothetical protein QNJ69_07550 [Gammaproteobacteria bacterium]|nr:hypothetical protein [Gammaproteobacteria bacterium]
MLKNLLQLTVLTVVWKRYRTVIISTLLLFLGFWLLGQLHDDYIRYSELNDDKRFLALSFFIKWSLYILAVVGYLLYNARFSLRVGSSKDPVQADSSNQSSGQPAQSADPFAEIRRRDKLRSRADFVIEKTRPHD